MLSLELADPIARLSEARGSLHTYCIGHSGWEAANMKNMNWTERGGLQVTNAVLA
jgi:hypothetical protein